MCVDDDTLDVRQIGVVLQGTHVEPSLFTELGYARAVIMGQGAICHDSISHLRVGDQVDLQQLQTSQDQSSAVADMEDSTENMLAK